MKKLRVGIYGATGNVGLEALEALASHPFMEVSRLYASERSAGKKYRDACTLDTQSLPEDIREMTVEPTDMDRVPKDIDVAFFALPEDVAKEYELRHAPEFVKHLTVITTSSALRMHERIPLVITEINPEHTELAENYRREYHSKGCPFPQCNCTAVPIAFALKPLLDDERVGVEEVHVDSYQSVSGSGARAVGSWDRQRLAEKGLPKPFLSELPLGNPEVTYEGNIRPIGPVDSREEETKVRQETLRMLGDYEDGRIVPAHFKLNCMCNRVPTLRGHFEHIWIRTTEPCTRDEIVSIYEEFNERCAKLFGDLPSSPEKAIVLLDRQPQTRFDVGLGGGMSIVVGPVELEDGWIRIRALSDNLAKGAAKGSIQLLEYLHKRGFL